MSFQLIGFFIDGQKRKHVSIMKEAESELSRGFWKMVVTIKHDNATFVYIADNESSVYSCYETAGIKTNNIGYVIGGIWHGKGSPEYDKEYQRRLASGKIIEY